MTAPQISRRAYPLVTVLMLVTGMFVHVYALARGREALFRDLFTPVFDITLAIPMTLAAIAYWWFRKEAPLPTRADRVAYYITAVYFTVSVPLHVQTAVTWNSHL